MMLWFIQGGPGILQVNQPWKSSIGESECSYEGQTYFLRSKKKYIQKDPMSIYMNKL